MSGVRRAGIRISAFFRKELIVTLGQRRLIVSVIFGPFLLLALFGAGFTGRGQSYRTVLVVPARANVPTDVGFYRPFFLWSLSLTGVTTDEADALRRLRQRKIDVVVIAPPNPLNDLAQDRPALFDVYYDRLDPVDGSKIGSLAYGETRELNARLEAAIITQVFAASGVQESNQTALGLLQQRLGANDTNGALTLIDQLAAAAVILRLSGEGFSGGTTSPQQAASIDAFLTALSTLRQDLGGGAGITPRQQADLAELSTAAARLPDVLNEVARISPRRLATPTDFRLTNLVPSIVSYMHYYAPVVVALLLQHMAVTLATLSVVKERTRGTFELFAIAPIRLTEIVLGKALSYGVILLVLTTILLVLMVQFLHVPLLGSLPELLLVLVLLIVVGIALGLIIAAVSTTESQAVQLAMLVLLFTVFFGGLFVPASNFVEPVRQLTLLAPLTHAGNAMRTIMLRGQAAPRGSLFGLLLMAALLCPAAMLLLRRALAPGGPAQGRHWWPHRYGQRPGR
jgi:ABC-2 type transport system permease protein